MQLGDFTALAKNYSRYRSGYSKEVLCNLLRQVRATQADFLVADVGAGTGIWTKMLAEEKLSVVAIEPNAVMREEGKNYTSGYPVEWVAGSAEKTGLASESVHWVTMASSFHWTDLEKSLAEFRRILKPAGFLTVLWNPREIEGDSLQEKIEKIFYERIPGFKRVSSGHEKVARDYAKELVATGEFESPCYLEGRHEVLMSKERYLGAWRSVNDIQAQAGQKLFEEILEEIATILGNVETIRVRYKTRSWTVRRS